MDCFNIDVVYFIKVVWILFCFEGFWFWVVWFCFFLKNNFFKFLNLIGVRLMEELYENWLRLM